MTRGQNRGLNMIIGKNYKYGKLTSHRDGTLEIFIPKAPWDMSKGAPKKKKTVPEDTELDIAMREQESKERSDRRTKATIKSHIRNNEHTHFITFTFDPKKYPDNESRLVYTDNWLKRMVKKLGAFDYAITFELHESGLIHLHGCMNLDKFELIPAHDPKTKKRLFDKSRREVFNLKEWRAGFTTVTKLGNKAKASNYVTKYITKDLDNIIPKGKKKYRASLSAKPEMRYLTSEEATNFLENHKVNYENEHGIFIDIS